MIIHSFNTYLLYTHDVPSTVPGSRATPVNQTDHKTNKAPNPHGAPGQPLKGFRVTLNGRGPEGGFRAEE